MGAYVLSQGAGVREGLAADGAGVWPFSGMGAIVTSQVT